MGTLSFVNRKFLYPFGLLAGGVIGVGIFGLPAAAARAGMKPFLLEGLAVIAIVWLIQAFFADVAMGTKGRHRIPGYARKYLGKSGQAAAAFSNILNLLGALLAYLIAGGVFLRLLLEPLVSLSPVQATLIYFAIGAVLIYRGVGKVAIVELILLALFVLTLVMLGWEAQTFFTWERVAGVGNGNTFLPYGVLLFAFWGMSLVPDVAEQTKNKQRARNVISASVLTAALAYLLFTVLVVGVTGNGTTGEAFEGLASVLGPGAIAIGLVFGLLTTFSSFLAYGLVLQETFHIDFSYSKLASWLMALFVPLGVFLIGMRELVIVLSITGAIFIGVEGLIVLMIAQSFYMKKKKDVFWPLVLISVLVFCLVFGVVFSLLNVFGF